MKRIAAMAALALSASLFASIAINASTGAVAGAETAAAAGRVNIRSIDTTAMPKVQIAAGIVGGSETQPNDVALTENGRRVDDLHVVRVGESDLRVGVVLVLDTSISMRTGDRLDRTKEAAKEFVAAKLPNEQVAIITAGEPARLVAPLTADTKTLNLAIDSLAPSGERSLWDGLDLANGLLNEHADLQGDIVLFTTGVDQASDITAGSASAGALAAKATLFTIGLKGADGIDVGSLQSVSSRTAGVFRDATDTAALPGVFTRVHQDIANEYVISYTTATTGALDLSVRIGAAVATASASPGTKATGLNTDPPVVGEGKAPSFLRSTTGKWIATGLVLFAAGLLAFGLLLLLSRENADLDAALRPYSDVPDDEEGDDAQQGLVFAETGLVQRAVATTARLADERGVLDKVEQRLEQASLPLRAAEALFFWVVAVALFGVLGLFLGGLFGAIVGLMILGLVPVAILNFLATKRKRKFVSQLPDALQLLASTLRAGYSLLQGVEAVSQEVEDPMGTELRRVLVEARLGRPLEESLQEAADRMGSADFDWAIMAIRVQREVGGNLAELLDTVGETMVQRERLRRDVKALTAEGRMSAILLAFLPPGVGVMMYTLNPSYMNALFHDSLGKTFLIAATVLAIVGFVWMKKMIEVEA